MFREVARTARKLGQEETLDLLRNELRGVLSVQGDDGYPYGIPLDHYYCDEDGLIYTSLGYQDNIGDYGFDYRTLTEPVISVLNPDSNEKKVIISVPIDHIEFEGKELVVCFMEVDMSPSFQINMIFSMVKN